MIRPRRRVLAAAVVVAAALVAVLAACELAGWPFLAPPIQRWLSGALDRRVVLVADGSQALRTSIRFLGGITIEAPYLEIGPPRWSNAPHLLLARDATIRLGYADLWRAHRGGPLHIRELRARQLDGELERLADGRASWQFGASTAPANAATPRLPAFGLLWVDSGSLRVRDALVGVDADARFSLAEGSKAEPHDAEGVADRKAAHEAGLRLEAKGRYGKHPVLVEARTTGVLPLVSNAEEAPRLPVYLRAQIGRVALSFDGTATDAIHLGGLAGRFSIQGPSLAAVGDPLRVTLPTTAPFRATGLLAKRGDVWNAVIEQAHIGASHLGGAFTYDRRPRVPMLAGRLTGSRLLLADLGPAIGTPVAKASSQGTAVKPEARPTPGRVLPDRAFDLPSLRVMDANVLIALDSLDLGSSIVEPLRPLHTHLALIDGVLLLRDLEARTGQGLLSGTVQLDGRQPSLALWSADLRWAGVKLESWIHQARAKDAPPYATGDLSGRARVSGEGRSTAAILGSLRGGVHMQLNRGTISHLAVEAAGLDIAQGLGVLVKGDDALPIDCTVADFVADKGVLRPRALVVDTPDSTLWADGTVSLANESIDMRVIVAPKDFSPLALRTPLHLQGSLAHPNVTLEKSGLGKRLGASALLALLNPLAALIPLIDPGDDADAQRGAEACRALAKRVATAPARAVR